MHIGLPLAALLEGEDRYLAWGEIDKMIVEQAAAIPFVWDMQILISWKLRDETVIRVEVLGFGPLEVQEALETAGLSQ